MTTTNAHADMALLRDTLATLRTMQSALLSGRVPRWALVCVAPSLTMLCHVLTEPSRTPQERKARAPKCRCGHTEDQHQYLVGHPDGIEECYGTDECPCSHFQPAEGAHGVPR